MVRAALLLLLLIASSAAAIAQGEKRIALLIGNQSYSTEIGRLANPHNDVALLERSLRGLGFEVLTVRDAGLAALHQAVNGYARRVHTAGTNAVAFFYYSGHGAADGGTNYVIPVDVKTTETGELWDQSLRLTEITRKLKAEAGNATHFVVFDACRNGLKLTRAGSRALVQSKGFVPVAQESGMLIAYATAEGELASDVGANAGPYAKVLAEEIVKPGVEAVVMFRAVQRRVRAAINQEPYLGFNAMGDVYLAGVSTEAPKPQVVTSPHVSDAERHWEKMKDSNSVGALEAFIRRYGDTFHGDLAKVRLEELKQQRTAITRPPTASPVPNALGTGGWSVLGCKHVSLSSDSDSIRLGRTSERFKSVRLHVSGNDLEMVDLRLVYSSNHEERIPIRQVIGSGQRTRPLDLSGQRPIESVSMVYRSVPNVRGSASVCVEGLQ